MLSSILNAVFGVFGFFVGLYAATHELKNATTRKYTQKGWACLLGLIVLFLCFVLNALMSFPTAATKDLIRSQQWSLFTIVWVIVLIACFLYTRLIKSVTSDTAPGNEQSRTNYLDALKTLTAAAGVAIAIVFTGTPKITSMAWMWIPQRAVILLALAMILSICTMFALSVFYDETRGVVTNGHPNPDPVKWKKLRFAVFIFYCALASFLMGFAYLARLPFYIRLDQPK